MGLFFPYLWMCVFFLALTRSTSLEHWIHQVLMNLQDIGQMGIEVAQRERRVTAVQVCGLNPAGWSILWTHGLSPYFWQFYASVSMQIAIFVFCYSTMWGNKIFLWRLSKKNNNNGSFLPHYGEVGMSFRNNRINVLAMRWAKRQITYISHVWYQWE